MGVAAKFVMVVDRQIECEMRISINKKFKVFLSLNIIDSGKLKDGHWPASKKCLLQSTVTKTSNMNMKEQNRHIFSCKSRDWA